VIRMSLQLEPHSVANMVPGMIFTDWLVDSILVFLSDEAVVLDVVATIKEVKTPKSMKHM